MTTYSAHDIDTMARTLFGEIRGGTLSDKIAVAWTIRNRADMDLGNDGKPDWWGEGIAGVCLKPWQFSCWNANDPNRDKLLKADISLASFRECLAVTAHVLGGKSTDPTKRATHYYNPDVVNEPHWVKGATLTGKIGAHLFYTNVP